MSDEASAAVTPGLTSRHYTRAYYEEHRCAGLDYLHCGEWQIRYAKWLASAFEPVGSKVLDVGCACGANLRGMVAAGLDGVGVDLSQFMVDLGRITWPDMAGRLYVCDAVNLHLFDAGQFDWLHSAQVAEHWRPDLVPAILRELRRVTRPGGVLFVALDTSELFERQGRLMASEDPTHICIRPMDWWHSQLREAGWHIASSDYRRRLVEAPGSYLRIYDWDWFCAVNP